MGRKGEMGSNFFFHFAPSPSHKGRGQLVYSRDVYGYGHVSCNKCLEITCLESQWPTRGGLDLSEHHPHQSRTTETPFNKWTATFFWEEWHKQIRGIVNNTGFMCLTSMLILKKKKGVLFFLFNFSCLCCSLWSASLISVCCWQNKLNLCCCNHHNESLKSLKWVNNMSHQVRELHLQPAPVPMLCN